MVDLPSSARLGIAFEQHDPCRTAIEVQKDDEHGTKRLIPWVQCRRKPASTTTSGLRADVILSTGMATAPEIEEVPGVLAFVFTDNDERSRAKFRTAFADPEGERTLPDHVIILHSASDSGEGQRKSISGPSIPWPRRSGSASPIMTDGIAIPVCGDSARCG